MKIITKEIKKEIDVSKYLDIFYQKSKDTALENVSNENVLFFDIETTGLNVKKTNTYLIGIVFYDLKELTWKRTQYFAESLNEEELILTTFNDICKNYKYIVHFNGDHFDIPYVEEKLAKYNLTSVIGQLHSLDIYTLVREYKSQLGLSNCKQKTIEVFLKLNRLDIYNGGELISQYYDYIRTKDKELYENLILHNAEDLEGMLELLNIIEYIKLIDILSSQDFKLDINSKLCTKDKLTFRLTFTDEQAANSINMLNISTFYLGGFIIETQSCSILNLTTPLIYGRMYHFFKDHSNYYYIKDVDMAVHKSVSKYIDKEKRENAKSSNCYIPKEGVFIPVFCTIDGTECFKKNYKDTQNYILFISEDGNTIVNDKNLLDSVSSSIHELAN